MLLAKCYYKVLERILVENLMWYWIDRGYGFVIALICYSLQYVFEAAECLVAIKAKLAISSLSCVKVFLGLSLTMKVNLSSYTVFIIENEY